MGHCNLYSKNGKYSKKSAFSRRKKWYLDMRLWFSIFIIIIISISYNYQRKISALEQENAALVVELSARTIPEVVEETVPPPTEEKQDSEAVALAKLADSVARGRTDEVKRIVMWVAINRSEDRSHGYGLSLIDEIARPKQWQEYNENANYLESTLRLAEEVLEIRDNGGARPIYGDMLWFVLNNDGSITVRNQFKTDKNRSEATFGQ